MRVPLFLAALALACAALPSGPEFEDAGISRVILKPDSTALQVGDSTLFTATVVGPAGRVIDKAVVFSLQDTLVARLRVTGVRSAYLIAKTAGTGLITATADKKHDGASYRVTARNGGCTGAYASVVVDPPVVSLGVADTASATATGQTNCGVVLTDSSGSWVSRNTGIATVAGYGTGTRSGRVTGVAPGSVWVVGTIAGLRDSTNVTVTSPAAPTTASVTLSPSAATMTQGGSRQFSVAGLLSNGQPAALSVTWVATGGTITQAGLYSAGGTVGTFRVIATDSSTKADTAAVSITATGEKAASADSFVQSVGANVHYSYRNLVYGNRALIASLVADLGVLHLRDGGVTSADPATNRLNYYPMDTLSRTLGVKWDIIVTPFETNQAVWSFTDTRGIDTVVKYLGSGNSTTGLSHVESWEGLNEWNSKRDTRAGWAAEDKLWQQTLWSYRATHPGPDVVGPSFTRYVDACTVGSLTAWMDFGNMHPYPAGRPQSASLQANIDGLACENGTDPLFATETGYQNALSSTSGNTATTETIAGRYYPRLWLGNFAKGVVRTYAYELIDQGVSSTNAELSFGLYRNDGTPKAAATSTKALLAALSDPGAAFALGGLSYGLVSSWDQVAGNLQHVLLQKRDGTVYLALWLDVTSLATPQTRALTVTFPVSHTGRVLPIPGSPTSWSGTSVAFTVSDAVTLIEVAP